MNITEIENAIYAWVTTASGVQAIFAYPGEKRPKTQYVLINILSTSPVGEPSVTNSVNGDQSITVLTETPSIVTVSLNVYYDGAFDKAKELKKSLDKVTIYESLYLDGLGVMTSTPARKIPEQIGKHWEERGQFDADFSFIDTTSETLEQIDKIEVTNEISTPSSTTIITKE